MITSVINHAQRTRSSDNEKVLSVLREWEFGLTAKEIAEDTGLSHWDVRIIIADLLRAGRVVGIRELRGGRHSRQWCIAYKLK